MDKSDIVKEIKKKKELSGLADLIIIKTLDEYLNKNKFSDKEISSLSEKNFKLLIKEVRSILRLNFGRFQISKKKFDFASNNDYLSILKTHTSTRERISFYPKLKEIIKDLKVKSILDLACGLNPIALASENYDYAAYDIDENELQLLNDFFREKKINGKALFSDIVDKNEIYPKSDICFLFKILDIVKNKEEVSRHLLKTLKCNYILVSFATKTLSGKPMKVKRREWFESILKNLSLDYKTFRSDNELFYLACKKEYGIKNSDCQ